MVNVLDFVNSKDIREHLKNIGYKCNPLEASWLVYQSRKHTLEEKMTAWNWIIENMDDCAVPERVNCSYRPSLHDALREYMDMENCRIARFNEEGTNVAYSYSYLFGREADWTEGEHLYSSPDMCWACIEDDLKDDELDNLVEVSITRDVIDNAGGWVTVHYNNRKKIMGVSSLAFDDKEQNIEYFFFNGMWFDFPVPFEKGDVVVRFDEGIYPIHRLEEGPFVLDDITPWYIARADEKRRASYMEGQNGDETDMNAWGQFQDDDGRIYSEAMFNYMDLELYRGSFDGKRRLLKALSSYKKNQISLDLVLTTYRKVIIDEFAEDVMLKSWYTDEGLMLAGLKPPQGN
jgi:hypothetical protein